MPLTLNQSRLRKVCEALLSALRTACDTVSPETPTISTTSYVWSAMFVLKGKGAGATRPDSNGLSLQPEAQLDADLEDRLGVVFNQSADLGDFEPIDVAQGLRGLLERVAYRLLNAVFGNPDHVDNLVGVVRHFFVLPKLAVPLNY